MEEECQRWRAGDARMRDNPEEDELDPAESVRRHCKKNLPSEGEEPQNVPPPKKNKNFELLNIES